MCCSCGGSGAPEGHRARALDAGADQTAASTAPTISSTTESNIASSSHSAMTRISVSVPDLRIRIRPLPLMRANSAGPEMADSYLFPNYYLCKDMLSDL